MTNGWLGVGILASFFLVILLGSMFAQMRFSGRGRFDVSFAAASFSTFGMAVLMSLENGLIQPSAVIITIALAIVGAFWLFFSEPNPY